MENRILDILEVFVNIIADEKTGYIQPRIIGCYNSTITKYGCISFCDILVMIARYYPWELDHVDLKVQATDDFWWFDANSLSDMINDAFRESILIGPLSRFSNY